MQPVDLIIHNAGQLVTCSSDGMPKRGSAMLELGIISNGAVAVADGEIVAVGNSAEIMHDLEPAEVLDVEEKVVCPGFVDPHTHIVFAGDRLNEFELKIKGADYLDILANGGGIISTVRHTRKALVDELVDMGLSRLDKMLACGTTTVEIKTGYGLDTETELKMLEVIAELDRCHAIEIVPTFLGAHAIPPEFKDNTDRYVDLICEEMMPLAWTWYEQSHFAELKRPFFCDVFTERNAFDLAQSRKIQRTAKALGFGIKAHVDQFTNLGGSRSSIRSKAVSIDHLDAISDEEIAELAQSDTIGIVIPTENFNAGKTQFANVRKMIDRDCAVALSTDYNPGSAPCPSMAMAMAISCRYQQVLPSEALNMATINAAFSIGLGETVGSIEVGKQADIVIYKSHDYRQISNEFGGNLVDRVIKKGKFV